MFAMGIWINGNISCHLTFTHPQPHYWVNNPWLNNKQSHTNLLIIPLAAEPREEMFWSREKDEKKEI